MSIEEIEQDLKLLNLCQLEEIPFSEDSDREIHHSTKLFQDEVEEGGYFHAMVVRGGNAILLGSVNGYSLRNVRIK